MLTVRYSSTRAEVWRWYWRMWLRPNGLWLSHLVGGLAFAFAFVATSRGDGHGFPSRLFVASAMIATLAWIGLSALWPQIRFKSAERTLTIDAEGWKTQIGKLSGSRSWRRVGSIEETGETIAIVGTNRNALIVPGRAFSDSAARQEFLSAARTLHMAAAA